jgi:ribosomal protein S18 acetylase RimI-like enzyme
MAIEIRPVSSHRDLKRFVRFPFTLYRGNPYWVPPLISDELNTLRTDRNPAFEHCTAKYWLAYDGREIVGRIAGIINRKFIERWKRNYARFSWIDFVDSPEVAAALYGAVEHWARSEGMEAVHGPLGFTDMDREGMLVEGFNELGTMATSYNYPYYPLHTELLGYTKEADWLEYEIKVPAEIPEKALKIAELTLERRRLHVLEARKAKDFLPYARGIFDVINETYKDLHGFVHLSEKQVDLYVKQYIPNVVPDYVKVILDEQDRVAGFVIAMPSLSRALQKARGRLFPFGFIHLLLALRRPKYLDLYLGAVRPDLQGKGADALLITELARSCIKNGIVSAESNLELETNVLVQGHWKYFERRQHKRRRCYIKHLTP